MYLKSYLLQLMKNQVWKEHVTVVVQRGVWNKLSTSYKNMFSFVIHNPHR